MSPPVPQATVTDCNCSTPWDVESSRLILTTAKNQPPQQTHQLPPGPTKTQAETTLNQLGHPPTRPWQTTTHTWNPTGGPGPKNRPCLLTVLGPQLVAIVDTPKYIGKTGHHCAECHTNWDSQETATLHKPSWRHPCTHPTQVRNVLTGRPLLRQGAAGVWSADRDSCWPEGCPPAALLQLGPHEKPSPWRWSVSCYGRLVAQAEDLGVQVGSERLACLRCPGRGPGGVCPTGGVFRL